MTIWLLSLLLCAALGWFVLSALRQVRRDGVGWGDAAWLLVELVVVAMAEL